MEIEPADSRYYSHILMPLVRREFARKDLINGGLKIKQYIVVSLRIDTLVRLIVTVPIVWPNGSISTKGSNINFSSSFRNKTNCGVEFCHQTRNNSKTAEEKNADVVKFPAEKLLLLIQMALYKYY